jgi:hypothetical protein
MQRDMKSLLSVANIAGHIYRGLVDRALGLIFDLIGSFLVAV